MSALFNQSSKEITVLRCLEVLVDILTNTMRGCHCKTKAKVNNLAHETQKDSKGASEVVNTSRQG